MKILMINNLYHPHVLGGAERVVQLLAESMVERGHRVTVASAAPGHGTQTRQVNGVTAHYLGVPKLLWPYYPGYNPKHVKLIWKGLDSLTVGMVGRLDRLLNREKPDVVHTHNLPGFSVAAWRAVKKRRLPLVHNLHDYSLLCGRSSMFKSENCEGQCLGCRLYAVSKKGPSRLVDAVVGVSRFVLERHLQYGFFSGARHQDVIFNSCEPRSDPATRARKVAAPVRLGFLGRLQPTKGLEWLLEALRRSSFEQWELWVAGAGDARYVDDLRRRYASPRVNFLGFVPPEELFRRIDALVVPSLWEEPFGMIIIESYAHGVPVIASRRGGIPEIVEEGRTGFLFDPESPSTFLAAIRKCVDEPECAAQMGTRASEKAKEFSRHRAVDRYLEVYELVRSGVLVSFQNDTSTRSGCWKG